MLAFIKMDNFGGMAAAEMAMQIGAVHTEYLKCHSRKWSYNR